MNVASFDIAVPAVPAIAIQEIEGLPRKLQGKMRMVPNQHRTALIPEVRHNGRVYRFQRIRGDRTVYFTCTGTGCDCAGQLQHVGSAWGYDRGFCFTYHSCV